MTAAKENIYNKNCPRSKGLKKVKLKWFQWVFRELNDTGRCFHRWELYSASKALIERVLTPPPPKAPTRQVEII
jgi:hypothetical protein